MESLDSSSSNDAAALAVVRDDPALRARGLEVVDVLGEGGSSVVYRAHDRRHGRDVAIKVIRQHAALDRAAERFAQELRVTAGLRHAHILPLYDSGVLADERAFAVMPVAQGRPLRAMIDEGPLTVNDAVRIAREVTEALAYLHERGYAHRDIKPENVLVESGHASLTDFGLATPLDGPNTPPPRDASWWLHSMEATRFTDVGSAVGTLAYMAPEALMGNETVDARSDLYALGYVLYEMLTGALPRMGASPAELLAQRDAGALPSMRRTRPDVPVELDAIVARCTAAEPAARYATARDLMNALLTVPSAGPAANPPGQRVRSTASLGLAALVVTMGAGVWAWHRERRATELDPQRVVVADLANDTGRPELARVGTLAGDIISGVLTDSSRFGVVNANVALPSREQRGLPVADSALSRTTRELVATTRAGLVVTGAYFATGDSLEVVAEVTDARSGRVLGLAGPVRLVAARPDSSLRDLGRQVVAVLRRRHLPPV